MIEWVQFVVVVVVAAVMVAAEVAVAVQIEIGQSVYRFAEMNMVGLAGMVLESF